eukprot:TRINITY_DN14573_c0_g1_i1.p1 TRINITY_DN14573_c0_g1~~TRINITY_DN14573_c0_g1_i1.p1  ORF type:complete len:385 (-),score=76.07 TRINITY_DN14573_c0_g1_i1:61-1215(-)
MPEQIGSYDAGQNEHRAEMEQHEPKEWSGELQEMRHKELELSSEECTGQRCTMEQLAQETTGSLEFEKLCVHDELKLLCGEDSQRLTSLRGVESRIRLIQEHSDAAIKRLRDRQAELKLETALGARLQLIEALEAKVRDRDCQIEGLELALSASEGNRRVAETETTCRHEALEARVAALEDDLEQARAQQAEASKSSQELEAQVAALEKQSKHAAQRQAEETKLSEGLRERAASLEDDLERAQKQCRELLCEDLHLATTLLEVESRERALRDQNARAMDRLSSRRTSIAVEQALAAQGLSHQQSRDSSSATLPREQSDKSKSEDQSCRSCDGSSSKTSSQDVGKDKCKICLSQVSCCTVVPCGHRVLGICLQWAQHDVQGATGT